MTNRHLRLKLLVSAIGIATMSTAAAANVEHLNAQPVSGQSVAALTSQLGLDSQAGLQKVTSVQDADGSTTVRMQQMYKGVPVYGRTVAVDKNEQGIATQVTGNVEKELANEIASVDPKLDADSARRQLRRHSQSGFFTANRTIENEQSQLYVYPAQSNAENDSARLVYLTSFVVHRAHEVTRPTAIVDANTGDIIKQWDGLTTDQIINADGPGGNEKTGLYHYGDEYDYLIATKNARGCSLKNDDVVTRDMNNSTSGNGSLVTFTCSTHSGHKVNGAYSAANDAHHFGQVVNDMYTDWFSSPPLNDALEMRVHYGNNYANAFWDGTGMTFGDGGSTFYPLVALDVTSHEISHGFTEQHSGLQYDGQSGGMNEAFSDMAGEAAEYFDRGANDWLVGADIYRGDGALRYMCHPSKDGSSIGNAGNYYDGMDVHHSSGVYNKAFCQLSKTTGWNVKSAFAVFERANALYWEANASFDSGACGVQYAADDLNESESDVIAAFDAVGVSCPDNGDGPGDGPGDPGDGNGGQDGTYENTQTFYIPDGGSVSSDISVSGEPGSAPGDMKVHVSIQHPYTGDLRITLYAPNGASVVLKQPSYYAAGSNIDKTWTVDASSVLGNGTWELQVEDAYYGYSGSLESWSLEF